MWVEEGLSLLLVSISASTWVEEGGKPPPGVDFGADGGGGGVVLPPGVDLVPT